MKARTKLRDPSDYSETERWPGDKGENKNGRDLPYFVKDWQGKEVFMVRVRPLNVPRHERTVMLWQKLGPHAEQFIDLSIREARGLGEELLRLAAICDRDDE